MSRVFWDTNLFIYLLEDFGRLTEQVRELRQAMIRREDQLITSTLTLGEVLVHPARIGRADIGVKHEKEIRQAAALIPFDLQAARIYGEIRCDKTIKAPDAIQLACA